MPVIIKIGRIKFCIYPHDHRPAHVHVIFAGSEAKFEISSGKCMSNHGFSKRSVKQLSKEVLNNQIDLLKAWKEFEGEE